MIEEAYACGQRVFAESRPQEFYEKARQMGWKGANDIKWHFIGHLQTNKLKLVLPYVTLLQSVDSERLLDAVNEWGAAEGRVIDILLEMHIASEQSKQGFTSTDIRRILYGPKTYSNVRFCGLMGMATFTFEEAVIRKDFARIKYLYDEVRGEALNDCSFVRDRLQNFTQLSIGMSNDYRIALGYGATMVRIGTDIFGDRY